VKHCRVSVVQNEAIQELKELEEKETKTEEDVKKIAEGKLLIQNRQEELLQL